MIRKGVYFFLCILINISCSGNAQEREQQADLKLVNTYKKYVENQFDYEGRDSILMRFKAQLRSALEDNKLQNYYFPEWDKEQAVVTSQDSTLTILSWDWENNGTYHTYESMYRYVKEGKSTVGFLYEHDRDFDEATSVVYYEINRLPDTTYLVKGWGTHGGGKEFLTLRKLSFQESGVSDCDACFDGEDFLKMHFNRGGNFEIIFNAENGNISYPEIVPSVRDGEETGGLEPTGKTITLQYKEGNYISNN